MCRTTQEQRDAEATLREVERLRALLVYRGVGAVRPGTVDDGLLEDVSRELRGPLNAVLGFAQLLHDDLPVEDRRAAAAEILQAGGQLQELLDALIGVPARTTTTTPPPPPLSIDVEQATRSALQRLGPSSHVVVHGPPARPAAAPAPLVSADPELLHDVVAEMVLAALRQAGSQLTGSCTAVDGAVLLTVEHDAPGRGSAQPAGQEEPERPLDLGVGIARRLAGLLGGTLVAGADGHRLVLSLPAGNAGAPAPAGTSSAVQGLTVVHIEDQASNVRLVERLLARRPDTALISAGTGRQGVDAVREHRPDVVLLDLHLPDVQGEAVLQQLLALDPGYRPVVAVLSADALPATVERLLADGATAFLVKPLDVALLYALLDDAEATRRQPAC